MNATVDELMHAPVMTITKHQTVGHARELMADHHISALPVVGPDRELLGIVTATDLLDAHGHAEGAPVSQVMAHEPLTVHPADGPHVAARIMRNHRIHHVVVVDDHRVTGMVSTFDLLRLVEDHRYQARQAPTPNNKAARRR